MPLRDSDIPMNVPFTLRNKQPFPRTWNYNEFINKTGICPYNNNKKMDSFGYYLLKYNCVIMFKEILKHTNQYSENDVKV